MVKKSGIPYSEKIKDSIKEADLLDKYNEDIDSSVSVSPNGRQRIPIFYNDDGIKEKPNYKYTNKERDSEPRLDEIFKGY